MSEVTVNVSRARADTRYFGCRDKFVYKPLNPSLARNDKLWNRNMYQSLEIPKIYRNQGSLWLL